VSFLTHVVAHLSDELIKNLMSIALRSSQRRDVRNYGRILETNGRAVEKATAAVSGGRSRADVAAALAAVREFRQAVDRAPLPDLLKAVDAELHLGLASTEEALISLGMVLDSIDGKREAGVAVSVRMRQGTTHIQVARRLLAAIR
jgi:hypothetical protein